MKYMDLKPTKSIHDLTLGELIANYSEEYKRKNNITIGKRIPVMWEAMCWTCSKPFLAEPYQSYCSESCRGIGEWREDNWRDE